MRASQLLFQLFQQPQLAVTLSADAWVHLIRLLRQQQQLARYAYLFRQAGVFTHLPQYARHHLRNAEIIADKQYRQVSAEAAELTQLLAPLQVKPVFLKGAAYALQQGLPAGIGRTFSDLDILVPKEQITAVEQRLSVFGFLPEPVSAYDQHYYRKWTHEIPPLRHHSRGTILDIHHNLIPPISGRAPDIRRFWQQLNLTVDGYQVLSLPAMTLHSLIHLFFNEDFKKGFRDLTDLHLLFAGFSEQDWEQLLQLAEQTAHRALADAGSSDTERIDWLYRNLLGRAATAAERQAICDFLAENPRDGSSSEAGQGASAADPRLAAWSQVVQTLFASLDFRYVE